MKRKREWVDPTIRIIDVSNGSGSDVDGEGDEVDS